MRRNKRKKLSVLMFGLLLLCGSICWNSMSVVGADSGTYDNINWNIDGTTLTITGKGDMPDFTSDTSAPWSNLNVSTVEIGNGITSVGNRNFAGMSSITSVSFPDTLTDIGEAAFYGCSGLEKITLPESVKVLHMAVFADCTSLTSFSAPGVTMMDWYTLQRTGLKTFEIPKGMNTFTSLTLYGCDNIEGYTVASGNKAFAVQGGVLYSNDKTTLIAYPAKSAETQFTIPSGVKKVGDYAFSNNKNLKSINFNNVTTLGDGAFAGSALSGSLVLSDKITQVGNFAFEGCSDITSVKFGKGLKESAYSMFENCSGIQSIDFGGLEKLGMRTFCECNGLVEVTLPDTMTEWGGSVFNSCASLVTFKAKGLKEIQYADFAQCYALENVILSGVENIYRQAFTNCSSLKEITLPVTTKWVDANAFAEDVKINCLNKSLVKFGKNGLHYAETINITGTRDYKKAFEVLSIVNKKRTEKGLTALKMDEELLESAMIRAGEQAVLYSHTRPDGSSCFTANKYMVAENIAIGQTSSTQVMTSWMNSQGHKENILLKDANTIGIGCFYINGVYTWVQCFGVQDTIDTVTAGQNKTVKQSISIPKDKFDEATDQKGIVWGELNEYLYKLKVETGKTEYQVGNTTKAKLWLVNPGYLSTVGFSSSNIKWSSSNTKVAGVDNNGKITFVGGGKVTITATTKYYRASVRLIVKSTPKLTLANKTVGYTGKGQKIGTVKVNGKSGSIKYYYYSDAKCTKKLSSYPVKIGTYYVKATSQANEYYNRATSNVAKLVIKRANPLTVNKTSVKYRTNTSTGKMSGNRRFTIGTRNALSKVTYTAGSKCKNYITVSRDGRVTVKKGTPEGKYSIYVKAGGSRTYAPVTRKVTITIYK